MSKRQFIAFALAIPLVMAGCSHKEQTSTSSSESNTAATPSAEAAASTAPVMSSGPTFVTFTFTDVAITTSSTPVLRLSFDLKNSGKDPLLCDPSEFSIQLSDGSIVAVDTSAEDSCLPDSIDPGTTAKAIMFFDLKNTYSGTVTLLQSVNNTLVGKGSTEVH